MQTITGDKTNARPCVATIGFFDGVHCGHRYLISQVCDAAAMRGLASAVVTFSVHPRRVMHPDFAPELLTTCAEKNHLLSETGIDLCLMLDFTPQLAQLSARQFMEQLKTRYHVQALVIGHDHRFGHNRDEGFDDYLCYGRELGMEVLLSRAYYYNICAEWGDEQGTVSSSCVRHLLKEGEVAHAATLLGYPYFLQGTVVKGYQVGRRIGYPTANLQVADSDKLVPADGVYVVRVRVQGDDYGGMLSIGHRPTFDNGPERSIEVHIFRFQGDIYDCPMRIEFVQRLRKELKFNSPDELIARLKQDEQQALAILS